MRFAWSFPPKWRGLLTLGWCRLVFIDMPWRRFAWGLSPKTPHAPPPPSPRRAVAAATAPLPPPLPPPPRARQGHITDVHTTNTTGQKILTPGECATNRSGARDAPPMLPCGDQKFHTHTCVWHGALKGPLDACCLFQSVRIFRPGLAAISALWGAGVGLWRA